MTTQPTLQTQKTRRRRGAPPGNQNARTHGYYSHTLAPWQEQTLLNGAALIHADRETATLCLKIASIMSADPQNYYVIRHAITSLARRLRDCQFLDADQLEHTLAELTTLAARLGLMEAIDRRLNPAARKADERSE